MSKLPIAPVSFASTKERRKNLEAFRSDAGGVALNVPTRVVTEDDRVDHPVIGLCFDVSSINFSDKGLPAMPQAGDVVGFYPENSIKHVRLLHALLKPVANKEVLMKGQYEKDKEKSFLYEDALKHVSLTAVNIELLKCIKKRLQENGKGQASEEHVILLNQLLKEYVENKEQCKKKLEHTHVSDVLRAFPNTLSLPELCQIQGANYRRVYTIAGVNRKEDGLPREIEVMVATRSGFLVPEGTFGAGNYYKGMGVDFVSRLHKQQEQKHHEVDFVEMFVQRRMMGLPEKQRNYYPGAKLDKTDDVFLSRLKAPLMIVVAGAGVSLALAALEERNAWKEKGYDVGGVTLVYGLHYKEQQGYVEKRLQTYQKNGLLERLIHAESRPLLGQRRYVQDVITQGECNGELKELVMQKRALMLCGDKRMGEEVTKVALPKMLQKIVDIGEGYHDSRARFTRASEMVGELKDSGAILQSTSGTRYENPEIGKFEAFELAVPLQKHQHITH